MTMDIAESRPVAAAAIAAGKSGGSWVVVENAPPVTPPSGYIPGRRIAADAATIVEALRSWTLEEGRDEGDMRHFRLRDGDRLAFVNVTLAVFLESAPPAETPSI